MGWEIWYGRLNSEPLDTSNRNPVGLTLEKHATEREALDYALRLIHQGVGVHSVREEATDDPKYYAETLNALANRELRTP